MNFPIRLILATLSIVKDTPIFKLHDIVLLLILAHVYVHDIIIVHAGSNSRLLSVRTKDLLNLLKQSYSSHKSKNVEFLITVEQLVHWLKGGRLTSCKSGKDRTSMSVTLEECSLLRTMHHLDNSAFNKTLSTLRRYVFSSLFPHAHKHYCNYVAQ